ncbi:RsmD family RNA methyltransferase [Saccharicrinis fermentans]|uniref:Ribosomal RNA small subunit methyltransferase D n=1 Tax=Saccharicrinis fermentans DSM 9555 = JCM 21142 TaxID=869213 RepID=W7Y723_9BACT|nr:RsmD family RNA methyltransferase [Saccharicrinis fermentans]GAF04057.1 ribosomal RNA small subunit methyltransferase D [Saccharicrinis fermentans DSM 9555 = JCM 21142]
MRIVSGSLKGRRFSPPKSFNARPTTDFAKENLFNVLNNKIDFTAIKVLDLFGGTGSISYEFASRGSNEVTCVEQRYSHFRYIKKTVSELDLESSVKVIRGDAFKYVEKTPEKFDLIFADPPYDLAGAEKLPDLILEYHLLNEGGIFIFEHSGLVSFESHPNFIENRENGKVIFTFFRP